MCGIAGYIGYDADQGKVFGLRALGELKHRGPDDQGIYSSNEITLIQTRLSILDLSPAGHQPLFSSCGRYVIVFNGEIYNHLVLREKYLKGHQFRGHSDTETIVELYRILGEQMLHQMVGMWAFIIWDAETKKAFVSRDRYGQKPLYLCRKESGIFFSSEIKPLLSVIKSVKAFPLAVVEYLALGNYGHLGTRTFYNDIFHFPQGCYAYMVPNETEIIYHKYWRLPEIAERDKRPFDGQAEKILHDAIVEAVLSQTLSDVPIGITLSGGIDSSIIAGILSTYYDKKVDVFTAQTPESKYDETKYVDAVLEKFGGRFTVHRNNLNELSLRQELERYINIQEEPFGDPSIIAHGQLMNMAALAGIKVLLNGQGADELFFGYNNMAQAVLLKQFRTFDYKKFVRNISAMRLGKAYLSRTLLKSLFPDIEYAIRLKMRKKKRNILSLEKLGAIDDNELSLYKYNNIYNVWCESVYGVHLPHLVHYDDRNGMAYGIEGRMPFLDHRVAETVASIRSRDLLLRGLRKYVLRETCKKYLPPVVYNRTDKIGFYTPLLKSIYKDSEWIGGIMAESELVNRNHLDALLQKLKNKTLSTNEGLQMWRFLSVSIWMKNYNIIN